MGGVPHPRSVRPNTYQHCPRERQARAGGAYGAGRLGGGQLKSKSVHLYIYNKDKPEILDSVHKLTGHTPKIKGEDGDTAMP